jgi:hypothetical protein
MGQSMRFRPGTGGPILSASDRNERARTLDKFMSQLLWLRFRQVDALFAHDADDFGMNADYTGAAPSESAEASFGSAN